MTFEWRTQESRRCDLDVSGVGVSYNRDMLGNLVNLAIAVASLFFRSHFVVRGDSMEPALRDGDLVHSVPRALLARGIRRGSIVVADARWGLDRIVIKRVAALPGEWVDVASDGAVFVYGRPEEHPPGVTGRICGERVQRGPAIGWVCGDDEYFLVGDNSVESADSRRLGPVGATDIIGCVWLRVPGHLIRR